MKQVSFVFMAMMKTKMKRAAKKKKKTNIIAHMTELLHKIMRAPIWLQSCK